MTPGVLQISVHRLGKELCLVGAGREKVCTYSVQTRVLSEYC